MAAKRFDFSAIKVDVGEIEVGDCDSSSDSAGDDQVQHVAESFKALKRKRSTEDIEVNFLAGEPRQGDDIVIASAGSQKKIYVIAQTSVQVPGDLPETFNGVYEFDGRSLTVADSAMTNPEVALALMRGSVMPLDKEAVNKLDHRVKLTVVIFGIWWRYVVTLKLMLGFNPPSSAKCKPTLNSHRRVREASGISYQAPSGQRRL
ncbi:hypothetical protein AQUCO_01100012v1 [Aquilegia coerulea]|uniref:Uncharacterized protein n=1 Tax=Aquilegia coerulea TaxID=218851 RepID=A0A2G5E566_AQUCA|nr:hypothetical protein AQUCO_01100012v1 [Aquilegia coerulea]